jgi:CDP-diacylglycerol--serine O-phosphatidyltransferase
MRLARFNVEQGGHAKTHFHGLPSPAAGMTLATYYWFSQTTLYTQSIVSNWPWHTVLPGVMLVLGLLMISHVIYPAPPTVSFRSVKSIAVSVLLVAVVIGVLFRPLSFAFPALVAYVAYGLAKTFLFGLVDRLPTGDPLLDEDVEDEFEARPIELAERPGRERRRRRRARGSKSGPQPIQRPRNEDGE